MATGLRQLAKDYAAGAIDRSEYLEQRKQFIEDVIAGRRELHEAEPVRAAPARRRGVTPGGSGPAASGRPAVLIGALVGVLLIIGGGAYLFWSGHKPKSPQPNMVRQEKPDPAQFVKDFLARNDWSHASVEQLVKHWDLLGADARSQVVHSPSYRFLGDAIYEQIVEEQALADLGDHRRAVAAQNYLAGVAHHFGMTGQRFNLAPAQPSGHSDRNAKTAAEVPAAAAGAGTPAVPGEAQGTPQAEDATSPAAQGTPAPTATGGAGKPGHPEAESRAMAQQPSGASAAAQAPAAGATPQVSAPPDALSPPTEQGRQRENATVKPAGPVAGNPQSARTTGPEQTTAKRGTGASTSQPEASGAASGTPETAAEKSGSQAPSPSKAQRREAPKASEPAAVEAAGRRTGPAGAAQAHKSVPLGEGAATAANKPPEPAESAQAHNRYACRSALAETRRPYCRDDLSDGKHGPTMVVIPAGRFRMGGSRSDEKPVHEVRIPRPLAISMHEISFREFALFCRATKRACPTQPWSGAEYPVVNVSWFDARAYTQWLSKETGRHYRLPSEAEWEYAARAGTTTPYPFGEEILPTNARFSFQTRLTSPLPNTDRSINRNRFRLYNMVGNVAEWVEDIWHENYQGAPTDGRPALGGNPSLRVVRGGSYKDGAAALRSAARAKHDAASGSPAIGFRVVEDLEKPADRSAIDRPTDSRRLSERHGRAFTLTLFAVH